MSYSKNAQARYNKANTCQINLKLNYKTDADIIRHLKDCSNVQGYIKSLILRDLDEMSLITVH